MPTIIHYAARLLLFYDADAAKTRHAHADIRRAISINTLRH